MTVGLRVKVKPTSVLWKGHVGTVLRSNGLGAYSVLVQLDARPGCSATECYFRPEDLEET